MRPPRPKCVALHQLWARHGNLPVLYAVQHINDRGEADLARYPNWVTAEHMLAVDSPWDCIGVHDESGIRYLVDDRFADGRETSNRARTIVAVTDGSTVEIRDSFGVLTTVAVSDLREPRYRRLPTIHSYPGVAVGQVYRTLDEKEVTIASHWLEAGASGDLWSCTDGSIVNVRSFIEKDGWVLVSSHRQTSDAPVPHVTTGTFGAILDTPSTARQAQARPLQDVPEWRVGSGVAQSLMTPEGRAMIAEAVMSRLGQRLMPMSYDSFHLGGYTVPVGDIFDGRRRADRLAREHARARVSEAQATREQNRRVVDAAMAKAPTDMHREGLFRALAGAAEDRDPLNLFQCARIVLALEAVDVALCGLRVPEPWRIQRARDAAADAFNPVAVKGHRPSLDARQAAAIDTYLRSRCPAAMGGR